VTGSVNYQVVGWFVSPANIGFLIPVTIINGAAFVALVIAMWIAWTGGHIFHPFHPRPVTIANHLDEEEQVPYEWESKVAYNPTMVRCNLVIIYSFVLILRFVLQVLKEYFKRNVAPNLKKDLHAVEHEFEKVGEGFVPGTSDRQQVDSSPAEDRPQQDIAPADDRL
jgi:hypothetical protein